MDPLTLFNYILLFLFGVTAGSFLNVCILRLPEGESIVTGIHHVERGYQDLPGDLRLLGASVRRT